MHTYIALLRGVTPTGKNKVPMAQLREVLSQAGFEAVRTYIQTGNVILQTNLSAKETEQRIHQLIREHIGPDLATLVRTADELQQVLDHNPFTKDYDQQRIFYVLLATAPKPERVAGIAARDFGDETLAVYPELRAAIMHIPGAYGRGTLSGTFLEKQLAVAATMRNTNTMRTLIELAHTVA